MKNNLVVGSNSFLGRALSEKLFHLNEEVMGVYNKNTVNLFTEIDHIHISELNKLKDTFNKVFIVSAYIPEATNNKDEKKLFDVNVLLVKKICDNFKSAKIIFCSSVSVYEKTNKVIKESSPLSPQDAYGISKIWGELMVKSHNKFSIVRISSIYGGNMNPKTFLPRVIKDALNKREIKIFGNGNRSQNYISVFDAVNYLISSSKSNIKNGIFLAVSSKSISNRKVAECIKNILKDIKLVFEGFDNSNSYIYNNEFSKTELNINSELDFKKGLIELINEQ